jgi:hypothetical protein
MILGGVDIHIKSGHGVNPYFDLRKPESPHWWRKMWFIMRNDVATPLPMFTGNRPIPQPNWGYGVIKKEFYKLQSLLKVAGWGGGGGK